MKKFYLPQIFGIALMASASLGSLQAQNYQTVEAVEYDPAENRWFVSNGGFSPIVVRNSDGTFGEFGTARATHGMEVMNGYLFACFNSNIRVYDLTDGSQVSSLSVVGAQFLNGMESDPANNRIWVTDFSAGRIYEIDCTDPTDLDPEAVVTNTQSAPNGIRLDAANDRLLFVTWGTGQIKAVDLTSYQVSTILADTGVDNIDGIDFDNDGNWFISSWSPNRITKYNSDFSVDESLFLAGVSSPADIGYALATDTLAIPNSGNSTVIFYHNDMTESIYDEALKTKQSQLYPNPVSAQSMLYFVLEAQAQVSVKVTDMQGKLVHDLYSGSMTAGKQRFALQGLDLEAGHYIISLQVDNQLETHTFVVH